MQGSKGNDSGGAVRVIDINLPAAALAVDFVAERAQGQFVRTIFGRARALFPCKICGATRFLPAETAHPLKVAQHIAVRPGERFIRYAGMLEPPPKQIGRATLAGQGVEIRCREPKLARDLIDLLKSHTSKLPPAG